MERRGFFGTVLGGLASALAIEALVKDVRHRRLTVFERWQAKPMREHRSAVVHFRGVSVRAISQYQIETDEKFLRLDVIGGKA